MYEQHKNLSSTSVTHEASINYLHCSLYANSKTLNYKVGFFVPRDDYLKATFFSVVYAKKHEIAELSLNHC